MPKEKIAILIITKLLLLFSCSSKSFETSEEMWAYLKNPKNEYFYSKNINGVEYTLFYKPTDLLVEQELSGEASSSKIDSVRDKYNRYLYFNLSMSKNNQELLSNVAGNKQQFGAMVNELAFGMEQKAHLYTQKKDTITMADYIYPRMYGMSGATTMLLVYPRDEKINDQEYLTLSIEDLGFYTGEVKFKIPTKVMNNEPKLKF
ncbi:hypothetical protein [Aquimarina pacifica]|uniref:hypothetical protein n=1 Tax=Aquimarina pacifica TaxID=1296415 RepID=UPI000471AF49|nr:hypothetical protein [Aquimarina pacifica]